MSSNIVEINALIKSYGNNEIPAVNIESLNINSGEIFGLLGPNGAGKTTTISMLTGVLRPSSGIIKIAGLNIKDKLLEIKKIIGVVTQDIALYPTLSAKENLIFFGEMYGLSTKILKDRINYYLMQFGLEMKANQRLDTFSGGMKRRVNLIAAILHEPEILFLDEPTVGIDVQSRAVILDQLSRMNSSGMSILYTSHHMEEAENFCTKIGIIDNGKLVVLGTPEELIAANSKYKNLEELFLSTTGKALRD